MTRRQIRLAELALVALAVAAVAARRSAVSSRDGRREWLRSPQAAFLAYRRDRLLAAELGDCGCGK
jgi:hypothetical protein